MQWSSNDNHCPTHLPTDMRHVGKLPWLLAWPSCPFGSAKLAPNCLNHHGKQAQIGHAVADRHRQSAPNVGSKQQQPWVVNVTLTNDHEVDVVVHQTHRDPWLGLPCCPRIINTNFGPSLCCYLRRGTHHSRCSRRGCCCCCCQLGGSRGWGAGSCCSARCCCS